MSRPQRISNIPDSFPGMSETPLMSLLKVESNSCAIQDARSSHLHLVQYSISMRGFSMVIFSEYKVNALIYYGDSLSEQFDVFCSPTKGVMQSGYPSSPVQKLLLSKYDLFGLKPSVSQLSSIRQIAGNNSPLSWLPDRCREYKFIKVKIPIGSSPVK